MEVNSRLTDSRSSFHLPPVPFHQPSGSSGRRDLRPTHPPSALRCPFRVGGLGCLRTRAMHPPGSCNHPLRGFVGNWRPREFGSTLEPDAFEADPSAEFTSGRRDLNPRFPFHHKLCEFRSYRCERVISSLPRNQFATKTGYSGFY